MSNKKISYDDLSQHLNFMGLDIKDCNLISSKRVKLQDVRETVISAEDDECLPDNSLMLFGYYEAFLRKNYRGDKEKAEIIEKVMALLRDTSLINVMPLRSENYVDNFYRVNEIFISILDGLEAFKLFSKISQDKEILDVIKDMSAKEIFDKFVVPNYSEDLQKFRLFALVALSKTEDTDIDYEIFEDNGLISDERLFFVLKCGLSKQEFTGDLKKSDNELKNDDRLIEDAKKALEKRKIENRDELEFKKREEILGNDYEVQKRLILRRPSFATMNYLTFNDKN